MAGQAPGIDLAAANRMFADSFPHCRELGIRICGIGDDWAEVQLDYQDRLVGDPATGVLHGGVITTLVDTVCGMAVFAKLKRFLAIATLDLRIDYLGPATPGARLVARAECYRTTRRIAFVHGSAFHAGEAPIANCVGTFMLNSSKAPPIDPRRAT